MLQSNNAACPKNAQRGRGHTFEQTNKSGIMIKSLDPLRAKKTFIRKKLGHTAVSAAVYVKERQDRLPTMYWLTKLHKRPYKARLIANSCSCTTAELSKLLISCLTAIKA